MKRKRVISVLSVLLLALVSVVSRGQSVTITVRDNEKTPLPGATVQLTKFSDSTKVIGVADKTGIARLEKLKDGEYLVKITFIGFAPLKESLSVSDRSLDFDFQMSEDMITMNEVVVTARKPLIRQEEDKMIIDTESMAGISTNTLEILESTPGLLVDQDGGIFLNSATPATIFINGREQKMSSQDIMIILRSLPPGSVQRVEVIRTPSAKYSASSSGGIVNIVLKRGVKIGRFGSIRAGMNQGVYGNQFAGFSLNNGGERANEYFNLEYSRNEMFEELNTARQLRTDTSLFQSSGTRRKANQAFTGFGISYDLSKKLNLSYDGRINGALPGSNSVNDNIIRLKDEEVVSQTKNTTKNSSAFASVRQDVGLIYRIDSLGSELDTRLSYAFNYNNGSQEYNNTFIIPGSPEITGEGDNLQKRNFFQIQSDLTYQMPLRIKLEAGISSTGQLYENRSEYHVFRNDTLSPDPFRTNSYNYRENINSGYLQASRLLMWELLLKTGIRIEHTYMKGIQSIPSDTSFIVRRADLFPYIYLSRPVLSIAGYELRAYAIYRKTISRPGYESLNPSIRYIDQFFYETGNPGLKPQFTENIELNVSFDDMPVFAIGRSKTRDIFSSVIYQDKLLQNVAVRTFDNLGNNREIYFRAVGGIPPSKGYFFYMGVQYNFNEYNGIYENSELSYNRGSWRFFTYHAVKITPSTRFTLNGFLMTKGQMNLYEMDNFGQLNAGLSQTFLDRKLTVTLSARDILRTMVNEFRLTQGSISTYGSRYSDNRRFGVNIMYNFGISTRKEKGEKMNFDVDE